MSHDAAIEMANAASPNTTPVDGIEILVSLAKTGKIDPWDLDIGEVTDQYLQILGRLKSQDLKLTGKTLLYAAILLRLKSDILAGINFLEMPSDGEPGEFDDADFLEAGLENPRGQLALLSKAFTSLDQLIQRRTSVKQPRNRKVTLDDLIRELKRVEALENKRRLKETVEKAERRRVRNFEDFSADDIVELAHEEFIEDTVARMLAILERFFLNDEPISLTELEIQGQIDRVSAYLAVLFLAARGEVELEQETFYGELLINPAAEDPLLAMPDDVPLEKMAG